MASLRKYVYKAAAKYYFKKPETAKLIEARYQTWSSLFYSALNLLAYNLKLERIFKLTSTTLELTNHCNLNCIMCPVNSTMKRKKGFMEWKFFKKVIDENPNLEFVLLFHWGESMLHPKLFEMIEYVTKKGIRPNLTTNGTLFNEITINKIVNSKLDRITISLDGADKVYEKIRRSSYKKVKENVDKLIKARNERKSNLKIDLSLNIFEMNENHVREFCKKWQDKVDRIQIHPRLYVEKGSDPRNIKRTKRCDEVWRGNLIVLWDGRVVPCCVDYEGVLVVGDANKEQLKSILNGKKIRQLRRNLINNKFFGICEDCHEYPTPIVNPRFS